MDYRRLAGTDLDVSVLCYGPTRIAENEPGWNPRSQAGARAMAAALDAGINFFHSSYEYRKGVRWLMNHVLKDHPKRHGIHHVVKVPAPDFEDGRKFTEAKFRFRVEEALDNLAADRIAVVQWMWRAEPNGDAELMPMLPAMIDDVTAAFERLRQEGKVGYLWTMPYTVPTSKAAIETGRFGGLLGYYNPLQMEMAELFPELDRRRMGFLCIRALYEGLLTDRRPTIASLPADDRLHAVQPAESYRKRDAIAAAFKDEIGDSMTRFAVRFPLFSPLVGSVILGLNTEQQVRDAVDMSKDVTARPDLIARAVELWKTDFSARAA